MIRTLAYRRLERIDSSIALSLKILPIAQKNGYTKEIKYLLNGLGVAYTYMANYDDALKAHYQALQLKENDSPYQIGLTLGNIGLIYYKIGNFEKALSYFHENLIAWNQSNDKFDKHGLRLNISLCYSNLKNFKLAEKYLKTVVRDCQSGCDDLINIEVAFAEGILHFEKEQLDSSEYSFLKAYNTATQLANSRYQLAVGYELSKIYLHRHQFDLAEYYLMSSMQTVKAPFNFELIKVYAQLAQLYKKTNNLKMMAHYQNEYVVLKDKIYNESLTNNLMRVEGEFRDHQNQDKLAEKDALIILKDEIIHRQRLLNIAVGVILVLLLVLLRMLFVRYNEKQRANRLLDQKVKERTEELERSLSIMLQEFQYERLNQQQEMKELVDLLATQKGLCLLMVKESDLSSLRSHGLEIAKIADDLRRRIKQKTAK
jgi:tetratricopeptide (TPR) repeat protein